MTGLYGGKGDNFTGGQTNTGGDERIAVVNDPNEEPSPVDWEGTEDEEVVSGLWHELIELGKNKRAAPTEEEWENAVRRWNKERRKELAVREAKRKFSRYFRERLGIEPFESCPSCGRGITRPRKNLYEQYFIGCGEYPACKYIVTRDDRDKITAALNELKDKILDRAEEKMEDVNKFLLLAKRIRDRDITYEEIKGIKREWSRYEK
jgi:hypothetical protein